MKLLVVSHKPCWPSPDASSGVATDGGFAFQMQALSELFDETRVMVPVRVVPDRTGEVPLTGHRLTVGPLSPRTGADASAKWSFIPWLLRNLPVIVREVRAADAVHAPIPGDVGTVGMIVAWLIRKPLFVRHCGNWNRTSTVAERFWRWFMVRTAGGRNVMLATGGADEAPSNGNPDIHWIFSSSLRRSELAAWSAMRTPRTSDAPVRLIHVARQEPGKGADVVIRSLPLLSSRYPSVTLDVVGTGTAVTHLKRLAAECGVEGLVTFTGRLGHDEVMAHLRRSTFFVFPTSSEGFPKVVLEAMACGVPVVATRVSVLPRLLAGGGGVLIETGTPDAVVQAVDDVLADSAQYERLSRAAAATAAAYSLEDWRDAIGAHLRSAWGALRDREAGPA